MSWLSVALMLLIAAATAAVVLLAARSGLDTHRDTIEVLHMLGSTDLQIARLFQRRIAFDTLLGGLIGSAAAMGLVWFLQTRIGGLGSEMLSGVALQQRDWFILLLLPISFALLATFAARSAVLRALGKTL
jgi:cell division transport system permease protein